MKTLALVALAHVAALAILISFGMWLGPTLDDYGQRFSGVVTVLSGAFGVYSFAANLLYHRSLRFHLWVSRLWLTLRPGHTYWRPAFDFELGEGSTADRLALLERVADAIEERYPGSVRREPGTHASRRLFLDGDLMCLVVRVDRGHLHLGLDRKALVPASLNHEYLRKFAAIAEAASRELGPVESRCGMLVEFGEGTRNPYYGFFVSRVPVRLVSRFEVAFRLSEDAGCRVEAGMDHVSVEGRSMVEFFDAASKVLDLRGLPVGEAG